MEFLVLILTPLEMLLVNLFVIHKCSKRKYGIVRTCVLMWLFIGVLLLVAYWLASRAPDFGNGNGLFIFCGFLFIFPIKLLYDTSGAKIITIACFSWTYTFLLFALSAKLGDALLIPGLSINAVVLILQTVMYVCTFKAFYSMLNKKFIYVLEHIGKEGPRALMWMTMMWFWTAFIINLSFSYPAFRIFKALSFITLAVGAISSFHYIYLQATGSTTIENLEKIAYQDDITQLRSRVVMARDAEELITRRIPFNMIFFDLNDFKSINDSYGHSVGDLYLAFFAHEIKVRTGNRGGFYRIAGDEFICILSDGKLDEFTASFTTLPKVMPGTEVEFLGFSYGVAAFPHDGATVNELLEFADQRMYEMKRSSGRARGASAAGAGASSSAQHSPAETPAVSVPPQPTSAETLAESVPAVSADPQSTITAQTSFGAVVLNSSEIASGAENPIGVEAPFRDGT